MSFHFKSRHGQDRPAAGLLESVYDFRLVRPPEEHVVETVVDRGAGQLGDRAVRISDPGAGEPDRVSGDVAGAAEDHAGSIVHFKSEYVCH